MAVTVVLAEDHPIVLQGLMHLFGRHPEFAIAGGYRNGEEALEAVRARNPDVLVLDYRLPGLSGVEVLRALAEERHPCRCVVWTAGLSDGDVVEAMKLGVKGIVLKESSAEALLDCVRRVHGGGVWYDPATISRALDTARRREADGRAARGALTPRELEVIRLVAEGLRNREIAERLFISEGTVKIHLHNIYEKLDLTGRLELVLYAQERGLL